MKNIFKIIIIVFCTLFFNTLNVHAALNDSILTTEYIDNVWSFHYRNGKVFTYGQLPFRYLNGKLAYCIDPPTPINASVYSSYDDFSVSGYTEEEKKQMELIAYYGYEYPGHNTIKYYMATQELIWLFSPDEHIKWTISNTSSSEEINIEKEKNEILDLVNKHNIFPSFVSRCYVEKYGTKLKLVDDNNVIGNYDIDTNLEYKVNGSTIEFNLNKFGSHTVYFKSRKSKSENTIVCKSDSTRSQTMAIFGFNDIKKSSFSIMSNDVKVRIYKRDKVTKKLIKDEGTAFKIKDLGTGNYRKKTYSVNENGYVDTSLSKGKYEIEEISASNGYIVNKDKIIVTIDENIKLNDSYYYVDFYNDVAKGKIIISKVNEEGMHIKGVEIGIFDKNYNLIKKVVTDENEFSIVDDLDLGTYYIKELSTTEGYILDDEYHKVELKYKDDQTSIVEESIKLVNSKIKCDVTYITEDIDKYGVKGITINLYNEFDEIVYSGKTDEEGKIIIKDLPYGKYYIKQVKVPSGYILNTDKVEFSVNDISCLADIKVTNKKTKMPITSSSSEKIKGFAILIFIGALIGIKKFI